MKNRKPMFENEMCEAVGLYATCNSCDRIIFEDENDRENYIEDGRGYCKECREETDGNLTEVANMTEAEFKEHYFKTKKGQY